MRWALVAASVAALGAEPGYTDPSACRPCHPAIFDSYQQTSMGRSFAKVSIVPPQATFVHKPSGRSYSIVEREGARFMRRQPGPVEKRIDYVIGSGNHSKTFLHRDESGRLIELPLSWYAEGGGSWHMSPGYDRPDHSDFRREVPDSCLFCHNGYPSKANGGLAHGIDCQRCHGPGEAHAQQRGGVVNLAKLGIDRQLEVCLQCHLESASRTLPDAVRRPGRSVFSYRPGEPLGDFITYFEFVHKPADERVMVNGSGYGMLKSACYLRSEGRLLCTTCHDPHRRLEPAAAAAQFTRVCQSCHAAAHPAGARDCTPCHMQKRRTEDAVHVVMTDHRIRRRPLSGDLLAMIPERHDRESGAVKPLYPPRPPDNPQTRLVHAMAQGSAALLESAIAEAKPTTSEPYFAWGEALKKAGRTREAIGAFRAAAERAQDDPIAFVAASELMLATGDASSAIALLEPALRRMPRDIGLLNSLAVLYVQQARFEDALRLLLTAESVRPDDPVTLLNLGVCREANGDRLGAIAAYRKSLLNQPDLARAREFLKRLEAAR